MEIPESIQKPNALAIRRQIDGWNARLWPYREKRGRIEVYANGGPPPQKNPKKDPLVTPLGLAKTFMTKARDALTDIFDQEPGPVYLKLAYPLNPERQAYVEGHVNSEFNKIIMTYVTDFILSAGMATISGTSAMYRTSPNDIQFRTGDILFPSNAPINPQDQTWREWAILSEITLSEIEELISKAAKSDKDEGWSKSALEMLKLYIMASEYKKRGEYWNNYWGPYNRERWLDQSISSMVDAGPISVAWYFRKNGKHTEDKDDATYYGDEQVDIMCISRFGALQSVQKGDGKTVYLSNSYSNNGETDFAELLKDNIMVPETQQPTENAILLYRKQSVFRSVDECLIVHSDDDRVAGHATLNEVRGVGRNTMGRHALVEGMLMSLVQGLTWAAMPHWQEAPTGVSVDKLRAMQQGGGLPAYGVIPAGLSPAAKNNSFAGFNQALQLLQMVDATMSSEAAATTPVFGGNRAEFQVDAEMAQSNVMKIAQRRFRKWVRSLKRVFTAQAQTLLRPFAEWKKNMPGYWPAMKFFNCLLNKYEIQPEEVTFDRFQVDARILAGSLQGKQAVQTAAQFIQLFSPIFPQLAQPLAREAVRAEYGDVMANLWLGPAPKDMTPAETATANALARGIVPTADPTVQALDYVTVGLQTAAPRVQLLAQQGEVGATEQFGLIALLEFCQQQAQRLPPNVAKQTIEQIQALGKTLGQIPVAPGATQRQNSLEERKVVIAEKQYERLAEAGEFNKQNKMSQTMLKSREVLDREAEQKVRMQQMEVQSAAQLQDMALKEVEARTPEPVEV